MQSPGPSLSPQTLNDIVAVNPTQTPRSRVVSAHSRFKLNGSTPRNHSGCCTCKQKEGRRVEKHAPHRDLTCKRWPGKEETDAHAASDGVGLKREQLTTSMPIWSGFRPAFLSTSLTAPNITISASMRAFAMEMIGGVLDKAAKMSK
jgi:hypothetical protein